jgi:hypothetical protein
MDEPTRDARAGRATGTFELHRIIFEIFNKIGIVSQLSSAMLDDVLPNGDTQAQFTTFENDLHLEIADALLDRERQVGASVLRYKCSNLQTQRAVLNAGGSPTSIVEKPTSSTINGGEVSIAGIANNVGFTEVTIAALIGHSKGVGHEQIHPFARHSYDKGC